MPLIDGATVLRRDERMIMRRGKDGWALVDPYRRTLLKLNPSAQLIWDLLDGTHTLAQVLERLKQEFQADEAVLEKDLQHFVAQLRQREMISG